MNEETTKRTSKTNPSPTTPTLKRGTRKAQARDWKPAFLKALCVYGVVRYACDRAKVDRTTAYAARTIDGKEGAALVQAQEFAEQWDDALSDGVDSLEREAWRRGRDGVERRVFYKGEPVEIEPPTGGDPVPVVEREYSDALLMFLLRAHRPERFRDTVRNELTGKDGAPLPAATTVIYIPDNGRDRDPATAGAADNNS